MNWKDIARNVILSLPVVKIPLRKKEELLSILCIHGVTQYEILGKTANYEGRHIHKDSFKDILKCLLRYFNPISLNRLDGYFYRGENLPRNPIFLTFDDG